MTTERDKLRKREGSIPLYYNQSVDSSHQKSSWAPAEKWRGADGTSQLNTDLMCDAGSGGDTDDDDDDVMYLWQ
jgi:hypothetical protein